MAAASDPKDNVSRKTTLLVLATVVAMVVWMMMYGAAPEGLTVYCAHDSVYSESVLKAFTTQTGIPVRIKFDTEATKSLGLVELIIHEQDARQCDVFWNNEVFGTMALAKKDLLEPYQGPGFKRIPAAFKDPAGRWCGFGGRFRVCIVNTEAIAPEPDAVAGILAASPSQFAIAKPLYGTTFTHYTVLWHTLGEAGLKSWHNAMRENGIREVLGNSTVKNIVANGTCAAGYTDTDDYFLAEDSGSPVDMFPVRTKGGQTICIPNTVAIIKGTREPEKARLLVDFLLSEATELALANSSSRQVPLGSVHPDKVPEQVRRMQPWIDDGIALTELDEAREQCLSWLKQDYTAEAGSK